MKAAIKVGGRWFRVGSMVVILLIAGGISQLASPSPDGLDAATLRGCQLIDSNGAEVLIGQCIAQSARGHMLAGSPLADYSFRGTEGSVGLAGIIGVAVTLAVAAGLFGIIARSSRSVRPPAAGGD